ncbi:MAG TPA: multidrug effflux MFS transporter [Polyangiales bacterium]|jgi:DHA1 family bicyclomycin/chloramphenicol resistance-like MFS transporter|nr:multidrug effflux MFS transporter [Polyangiales bacterium]
MFSSLPSTPPAQAKHSRLLIFSLGVLTAFAPISIDMYLPSLPSIGKSLQSDPAQVQLTLATFMFGMGIGQLIYGPLSDRYGRRKPLVCGIAIYSLSSLGCALAPRIEALIALRFLQALGGAAGPVIARAVVRDLFSGPDIARVLSIMTLVMGAAPILAPLLGGAVLATASWRAIFFILTGVGIAAAILAHWQLPRGPHTPPTAALAHNLRRLATDKRFVTSALAGACAQVTMFAYISSAPFVLMTLRRVDAHEFALIFGSNAAGFISATQFNRLLLRRFPIAKIAQGAALWLCVAHAGLLIATLTGVDTLTFAATLFVCVIGLGLVFPNVTAIALQGHADIAGLASSVLGAVQFGSGAIAAVVVANDRSAYPMVIAMCAGAVCTLLMTTRLTRDS